jgi:imidazolonepropionase-like amidohydrolase
MMAGLTRGPGFAVRHANDGGQRISTKGEESLRSQCRRLVRAIGCGFLLGSTAFSVSAQSLRIHAGRVLDVEQGRVLDDQAILVVDGRVAAVQPFAQSQAVAGGRELDWSAYSVLPGLMDMHTHLAGDIQNASVEAYLSAKPEDDVLVGAANARRTLQAGFTTVRDVGSYNAFVDVSLRDAIAKGWIPGPRMFVAGAYVTVPGGGGEVSGLVDANRIPPRMRMGVARGENEVSQATERLVEHGVDWIKLIVTGAVLTDGTDVRQLEFGEAEVRTAVRTAAKRRIDVTAHAHGAEGIRAAIRGGVRSIEHASLIDADGIALARERGTWLVMDIYNGDYIDTVGRAQGWSAETLRKNFDTTEAQRNGFRAAVQAGVRLAFGTDAGVYPHGDNARQFAYMVKYGMTPMQAIQSATIESARLLRKEDELGSIAPGKWADVIAVACDPLQDVECLRQVRAVLKAGQPVAME